METKENVETEKKNGASAGAEASVKKTRTGAAAVVLFSVICLLLAGLAVFICLTAVRAGGENRELSDRFTQLSERVGRLTDKLSRSMGFLERSNHSPLPSYI